MSIRQALFIAPCSHAFHYKCIRPLLETHHAAFSCPLCRTFADLEEDVEVEAEEANAAADDLAGEAEESASGEGDPGPVGATLPPSISPRARERSRDRDGGGETEVEADGNGGLAARLGMQRSQTRVHQANSQMNPAINLTELNQRDGGDTEMMDAIPDASECMSFEYVDMDAVDGVRRTSLSPDLAHGGVGQAIGMSGAGASGMAVGDTSEGEGSGGSAEGVLMDAEIGDEEGNGDLAVGAKRKR